MKAFRLLLAAFALSVVFFAIRYLLTGRRSDLSWAGRLLAVGLVLGVVFFALLLASRFL